MSSSKLTPRELTYDENGEDFSDIIRRRTNIYINDINDDSDKSSTDDDDEYSGKLTFTFHKFLFSWSLIKI